MKKTFFIYSLPRSGSAWLSQFLSWGDTFCYHEPFADMDVEELKDRWESRPEKVVGAIDTSAYLRDIEIPGDLKFVLLRNVVDIELSAKKAGILGQRRVQEEWEKLVKKSGNAERIAYSQLRSIQYLEGLWNVIVGTDFDAERSLRFSEMIVNRELASVLQRSYYGSH